MNNINENLIPSLYNLDTVENEYKQSDWCIEESAKRVKTMLLGAEKIKDHSYRNEFLQNAQLAFEKKYGLNRHVGIKILMIAADFGGCGYVRIEKPAKYLNREPDIVAFPTVKVTPELASWANVVVWQRQYKKELLPLMEACKKTGKIQIFDIDDNLHAIEKTNPAYEAYSPGSEGYTEMLKWIRGSDILTVTRPELGEFYKDFSGIKNYYVLPNCIDFEDVPDCKLEKNNKKIRIGWAGSTTHYEDLKESAYAIKRIKEKYGDSIEIVMMGFDGKMRRWFKKDINGSRKPENLELRITGDAFDGIKREYHKFTQVKNYYKSLAELNLDIAIIPLTRNKFNDTGKSNLKYLEFSAVKVPSVVSKAPAYKDDIKNGENGFLCKRESDFEKYLMMLIEDKALRHKIAQNAYDYVKNNYDMSVRVSDWANKYREMFQKQNNI